MAKTVYLDANNGNDLNDGLSWVNAKKTFAGARAATSSWDLVLIAPGVYPEPYTVWGGTNDTGVLYRRAPTLPGRVIVDFQNSLTVYQNGYWFMQDNADYLRFMDIHFRNPKGGSYIVQTVNPTKCGFFHCVFYQRDGTANTGRGLGPYNSNLNEVSAYNCSFYNLQYGMYQTDGEKFGNYIENCTDSWYQPQNVHGYNAWPGNTEGTGINTTTGANPGFTDAANEDFTLNVANAADWQTFMSSGYQGAGIGAWANGGILYRPDVPQLRYFAADQAPTVAEGNPQPAWENEGPNGTATYIKGIPTDVIRNSTTGELELDLNAVPLATGGRIMSDVMAIGSGSNLIRSFHFGGYEDKPAGAMIDTNTTLPQRAEYRSSSSSFLKDAGSPAWVEYEVGDNINITTDSYVQMRIELRTDHTNA